MIRTAYRPARSKCDTAASMPPALPRPGVSSSTLTPRAAATLAVASVQPSATTCTFSAGTSLSTESMVAAMTGSSLCAGISAATSDGVNRARAGGRWSAPPPSRSAVNRTPPTTVHGVRFTPRMRISKRRPCPLPVPGRRRDDPDRPPPLRQHAAAPPAEREQHVDRGQVGHEPAADLRVDRMGELLRAHGDPGPVELLPLHVLVVGAVGAGQVLGAAHAADQLHQAPGAVARVRHLAGPHDPHRRGEVVAEPSRSGPG